MYHVVRMFLLLHHFVKEQLQCLTAGYSHWIEVKIHVLTVLSYLCLSDYTNLSLFVSILYIQWRGSYLRLYLEGFLLGSGFSSLKLKINCSSFSFSFFSAVGFIGAILNVFLAKSLMDLQFAK